jgi:polysaccharide biosynthesis protein PelF
MKICMIAEGSYPYVTGGVSSWINSIIKEMPDAQFIIYAIAAEQKSKNKFKYVLPENVIEVKEVFLDTHLNEHGEWGKRFKLTANDKQNLFHLISGEQDVNWLALFTLLKQPKFKHVSEFLSSRDFLDLIKLLAERKYSEVPFTELFWTVGSMILPLLLIIQDDIPEADIYHTVSTGYAGVVGGLAKAIHNKPVILTEHGIYSREREEEIIKASWVKGYFKDLWINYFYTLSNAIYQLSDEVITLFHKNKEIEIELGCAPEKINIIPNGIEVKEYEDIQLHALSPNIRIGAIVRVVPIKDIKMMLQAYSLVQQAIPNSELFILGPFEEDEQYYKECLDYAQSLMLQNVYFTGMVNIKEYLGNLDLLVLTSISEGQPLAILEGFACAKPYVATNVGSCKELIEGTGDSYGPAGFVVPVMHYEEMAKRIIQLANNPELRKTMGQNGFNRVSNLYQKTTLINRYRSLYEKVGGGM